MFTRAQWHDHNANSPDRLTWDEFVEWSQARQFAEGGSEWVQFTTRNDTIAWRNSSTGERRYQSEKPTGRGGGGESKEGGAADGNTSGKKSTQIIASAYADFRDKKPGRNEPEGEPLDPQVVLYWDAWKGAVEGKTSDFMRDQNKEEEADPQPAGDGEGEGEGEAARFSSKSEAESAASNAPGFGVTFISDHYANVYGVPRSGWYLMRSGEGKELIFANATDLKKA